MQAVMAGDRSGRRVGDAHPCGAPCPPLSCCRPRPWDGGAPRPMAFPRADALRTPGARRTAGRGRQRDRCARAKPASAEARCRGDTISRGDQRSGVPHSPPYRAGWAVCRLSGPGGHGHRSRVPPRHPAGDRTGVGAAHRAGSRPRRGLRFDHGANARGWDRREDRGPARPTCDLLRGASSPSVMPEVRLTLSSLTGPEAPDRFPFVTHRVRPVS